jgi:hypothetical protein
MISAMLLALAATASPFEQSPWWHCLRKETVRLERSGEKPRDVAIAAMDRCRSAESDYAATHNYGLALMRAMRPKVEDRVVAMVVELRADRKLK